MDKIIIVAFLMGLGLVSAAGLQVLEFDANQAARDLIAIQERNN